MTASPNVRISEDFVIETYGSFQEAAYAAKRVAELTKTAASVLRSDGKWTMKGKASYAEYERSIIDEALEEVRRKDDEELVSWLETELEDMKYSDETATYGLQPLDWQKDEEPDTSLPQWLHEIQIEEQIKEDLKWQKKPCEHCCNGVSEDGKTCRKCRGAGYFDFKP